jgi:hypothetical protein
MFEAEAENFEDCLGGTEQASRLAAMSRIGCKRSQDPGA